MKRIVYIKLLLMILFILSACASSEDTYNEDAMNVQLELLTVAAQAEEMINLYGEVWSISMNEESGIESELLAEKLEVSVFDLDDYFIVEDDGTRNPYMDTEGKRVIKQEPNDVISG